ncbi:MAG: HDOD domain-containing protein [Gammaproteobacteria bacterium]|nr:HDOD domain-containing protein [Gammaproteobacteria bacterium]
MDNSIFVARQPIYDSHLEIYGYELLYRDAPGAKTAKIIDGNQATASVVTNAFLEIGIDKLVGPGKAFINITKDFLTSHTDIPHTKNKVVLEILEDIPPTEETCAAVAALHERGYTLALDDFVFEPRKEAFFPFVSIIKFDARLQSREALQRDIKKLTRFTGKLLAEKIESKEEYEFFKNIGFTYFQGFFLAKPQVMEGRKLPQNKIAILQLLREMQNPNVNISVLEKHVLSDVALSYKIISYINSPAVGLRVKVESIKSALILLGMDALKHWVTLIALSGLSEHGREMLRIALVRAKMSEGLAKALGKLNADTAFTVGLFSILDAMLDLPIHEVVNKIGLSGDVASALMLHQGPLGDLLNCALSFESGDWDRLPEIHLTFDDIQRCFTEGIVYADEMVANL